MDFRERLNAILVGWQARVACCLREAQSAGTIPATLDVEQLAEFFWIAWEGAVLRARLVQSDRPLVTFIEAYLSSLGARAQGLPRHAADH